LLGHIQALGAHSAMNRRTLRRAAISVAIVLCIASLKWPQVQGVATILLLLVIFEYVLLTQENTELFRRQLERQERVHVHFELICRNGPLLIRVSNLGVSNFLVDAIHVRTQDIDEFHYSTADVVESGKTALIDLPREVCAGRPLTVDLEITLEVVGMDVRSKTEPQCFNVGMALDGIPNRVKRGVDAIWSLTCPKCNAGLLLLSLQGLETFDDVFARKREALEDFQNSCPNHASKWLMKNEDG
jgi:hypothetical protein